MVGDTAGLADTAETDALFIGAVPEGKLLFDVAPVSKGVDVTFDSGYGAENDSGDAVEVEDVTLPMTVNEAVEFW